MNELNNTSPHKDAAAAENGAAIRDSGAIYKSEGARLGMWLFIFTEVLLFGVLFMIFAVFLYQHGLDFRLGSRELSIPLGALNTFILITSSFTMALAIHANSKDKARTSKGLLVVTILLAFSFLVVKSFEWSAKFHHGIYPNSPELLAMDKGHIAFFGLYFVMTGLHAFHIIVGIIVILISLYFITRNKVNKENADFLVNAGLYWHLVDLVWIYLFPLFYLIS